MYDVALPVYFKKDLVGRHSTCLALGEGTLGFLCPALDQIFGEDRSLGSSPKIVRVLSRCEEEVLILMCTSSGYDVH